MARLSYPPRADRSRQGDVARKLAGDVLRRAEGAGRFIVAICGAPGAGKSTLAEAVAGAIAASGETVAVVPMDGFHFDDGVLAARGLLARKGAPETFDVAGFGVLLRRLRACEPDVAIPIFDRSIEIARAGAAIVAAETRILLIEGNYLLLDEEPWRGLGPCFDLSVFIDVPFDELTRRLIKRWMGHGHPEDEAIERARSNDIPNAERIVTGSRAAEIVI